MLSRDDRSGSAAATPKRWSRVRGHGVVLLAFAALGCTGHAHAQIKKCEQLRSEIASRLPWPKGSYRLDIVPIDEPSAGKLLGRCEGATRKIVAFRAGDTIEPQPAAKPAATEAAAPVTPSATVVATPAAASAAPAVPPATAAAPRAEQQPAPAATVTPPPMAQASSPAAPAAVQEPPAAAVVIPDEPTSAVPSPAASAAAAAAQKRLSIEMPERINITDDLEIKVTFDVGDQNILARLKSPNKGVTVTPEEPVEPEQINGQSATWTWVVTPENTGKLNLDIALIATPSNGQAARTVTLARTVRSVVVERTLMQSVSDFASKNFQWLWTAILLPVAGLYWRSRRKQAESAGTGAAS